MVCCLLIQGAVGSLVNANIGRNSLPLLWLMRQLLRHPPPTVSEPFLAGEVLPMAHIIICQYNPQSIALIQISQAVLSQRHLTSVLCQRVLLCLLVKLNFQRKYCKTIHDKFVHSSVQTLYTCLYCC